jgi:hypothetical protein
VFRRVHAARGSPLGYAKSRRSQSGRLQADCVSRSASALVGRARRLSGVDGGRPAAEEFERLLRARTGLGGVREDRQSVVCGELPLVSVYMSEPSARITAIAPWSVAGLLTKASQRPARDQVRLWSTAVALVCSRCLSLPSGRISQISLPCQRTRPKAIQPPAGDQEARANRRFSSSAHTAATYSSSTRTSSATPINRDLASTRSSSELGVEVDRLRLTPPQKVGRSPDGQAAP